MELIDNFLEDLWRKGSFESRKGYGEYRIIRSYKLGTHFEYAVFDNDGGMQKLTLHGSSSKTYDPLNGLNNVYLFMDEADKLSITGVIVEDEAVVKRGSEAERLLEEYEERMKTMNHVEEAPAEDTPAQANGEGSDEAQEPEEEDQDRNLSVKKKKSPHCATCTCDQ